MNIIKKGNKILFQQDGKALDSLDISKDIRPNKEEKLIYFSNSDFTISFDNFTSITDENGLVKLKSDFTDFTDFYKYFQENIFFLTKNQIPPNVEVDGVTIQFNAEDELEVAKVDGDFQNILLKKSSSDAAPVPVLPFGTPYLLSTLDGKDKLFSGDRADLNSLLNVPPFAKIYNKTFATAVTINQDATYNLMTSLLNSDVPAINEFNLEDLTTKFSINSTQVSIQFPPFVQYCQYSIRVILRGSISGSSSTDRQFGVQLRRGADNSSITEQIVVRVDFTDLANLGLNFISFTNGVLDPFSQPNNGLRILVNNTSGSPIILTGFQILIQGNPTNLKKV